MTSAFIAEVDIDGISYMAVIRTLPAVAMFTDNFLTNFSGMGYIYPVLTIVRLSELCFSNINRRTTYKNKQELFIWMHSGVSGNPFKQTSKKNFIGSTNSSDHIIHTIA